MIADAFIVQNGHIFMTHHYQDKLRKYNYWSEKSNDRSQLMTNSAYIKDTIEWSMDLRCGFWRENTKQLLIANGS